VNRSRFLGILAALPIVGGFVKAAAPEPPCPFCLYGECWGHYVIKHDDLRLDLTKPTEWTFAPSTVVGFLNAPAGNTGGP
jgi:hypothetical protein